MSDGYIVIKNWEKFQHPDAIRSSHMPWLKLHTELLGNDAWLELRPSDRVLHIGLLMLTSRYGNGRIKADSKWLCAQLKLDWSGRYRGLERLSDAGFITLRASKAASRSASKVASTEKIKSKKENKNPLNPPVELAARPDVHAVWTEYEQRHPRAVLTKPRRDLITRRLRDYDAATLVAAIAGNHADPYCNGENRDQKEYHGFELIFRDADHIEKYAATAPTNGNGQVTPADMEAMRQQAKELGWE